jgi:hypothetical protein
VLADMPASAVAAQAKMQEDAGLDGLLAPQLYSTPFIPLAIAATATSRIRLLSGIALAFTRSPYETALAAMDMDRISGGRFILGLGCSVRALSEEIYGMPYGKPLEHMREVVEIIRSVIGKAHTGELKRYEGIYHKHDFTTLEWLSPPSPLRTNLPIWIAALRRPLVSRAADVAGGVINTGADIAGDSVDCAFHPRECALATAENAVNALQGLSQALPYISTGVQLADLLPIWGSIPFVDIALTPVGVALDVAAFGFGTYDVWSSSCSTKKKTGMTFNNIVNLGAGLAGQGLSAFASPTIIGPGIIAGLTSSVEATLYTSNQLAMSRCDKE